MSQPAALACTCWGWRAGLALREASRSGWLGMVQVARRSGHSTSLPVPAAEVRGHSGAASSGRSLGVQAGILGSAMRCHRAVDPRAAPSTAAGGAIPPPPRGAAVGLGTGPGVAEATRPLGRGARPGWLPGGRRNVRRRGVQGAVREVLHRGRQHVRVGSAGQGAGRHGSSHREFGGEDGTEHALAPAVWACSAGRGGRTGPGMRPGRPVLRLARGRLAPRGGPR